MGVGGTYAIAPVIKADSLSLSLSPELNYIIFLLPTHADISKFEVSLQFCKGVDRPPYILGHNYCLTFLVVNARITKTLTISIICHFIKLDQVQRLSTLYFTYPTLTEQKQKMKKRIRPWNWWLSLARFTHRSRILDGPPTNRAQLQSGASGRRVGCRTCFLAIKPQKKHYSRLHGGD
jgi:hypothetical protein